MSLGHLTRSWIGDGVGQGARSVSQGTRSEVFVLCLFPYLCSCWNQPDRCLCRISSVLVSMILVYLLVFYGVYESGRFRAG
jgi:hypothetical protein